MPFIISFIYNENTSLTRTFCIILFISNKFRKTVSKEACYAPNRGEK